MKKFIELTSFISGRWFLLSAESIVSLSLLKDSYTEKEGCRIETLGEHTYCVKETMTEVIKRILWLKEDHKILKEESKV